MSGKAAERSLLLMHFGQLLAPVATLAERVTPPSFTEYRVATAQFEQDEVKWRQEVERFAMMGTCKFNNEFNKITGEVRKFRRYLCNSIIQSSDPAENQRCLRHELANLKRTIGSLINLIPLDWEPILTESKTPFATCLMVGDAMITARKRLDYIDRYLDADFFPLYLRRVERTVNVTLVTTRNGVVAVQALSALAAKEFDSFSLVECSPAEMHDRNLRVDNQVFHLGPSANGAGKYPTNFNPADSTASGHKILDDLIAKGTKVI